MVFFTLILIIDISFSFVKVLIFLDWVVIDLLLLLVISNYLTTTSINITISITIKIIYICHFMVLLITHDKSIIQIKRIIIIKTVFVLINICQRCQIYYWFWWWWKRKDHINKKVLVHFINTTQLLTFIIIITITIITVIYILFVVSFFDRIKHRRLNLTRQYQCLILRYCTLWCQSVIKCIN